MARSTVTSTNGVSRIDYEQDPDDEDTHPGPAGRVTMLGIVAGLSELRTEVLNFGAETAKFSSEVMKLGRAVRRLAWSVVVWGLAVLLVAVVLWWAR